MEQRSDKVPAAEYEASGTGRAWAVEATGLVKRFGDVVAVDGLDLRVAQGSVYGLLGPNGAGKTPAVRMLATLSRPDCGEILIFGEDAVGRAAAVRRRIALTGQFASVDEDLTGSENLVLIARLLGHRIPRARRRSDALLAAFGLSDAAGRLVKTYSGGMRRRLDIAASLVVRPDILFLDEPTTGLDPRSRRQIWDVLRAMVARGTTVLLTTQYLEEADALADRVAVIDHGRVVAEGTPAELKARVGAGSVRIRLADPAQHQAAAVAVAESIGAAAETAGDPLVLTIRTSDDRQALGVLASLVGRDIALADFSIGQPTLDEAFLELTGQRTDKSDAA